MDKLVKLLALAASDNDSEALAAMRAAGRRLKELNLNWNDMAVMLGRAAADIIKKREARNRSEKRARFKASPQGKIAAYRRFVREHKKALKSGDEMKAFLWHMRAEKALEDMDPETRERLTQLDRRRKRRGLVQADIGDPIKWGSAA
jgi:hypothetical protein